eukprot:TRINITY_DN228_c0_g4_i1.p1 TRINITY_DN228_c0_g4~~TRINITY_DN228_c0_g4_i1.p1  ORF type:complete len:2256 (+),score=886.13 TRINITY_DN228_c0_g4_i1:238-7005(+)
MKTSKSKVIENPLSGFNDAILLPAKNQGKKSKRSLLLSAVAGICVVAIAMCVILTSGSSQSHSDEASFSQNIVDNESVSLTIFMDMDDSVVESCFGSADLNVHSHSVSDEHILIEGSTKLHEIACDSLVVIRSDNDIVIENHPNNDNWNVADAKIGFDDSNWESSQPTFIFSKTKKEYTVRRGIHKGTIVPLEVGLNSIHNLSTVSNKPLSMIFGANPSTAAGRLLQDDDLYLKISGSLKPKTNLKSVMKPGPISLGNGLTLTDSTFSVEALGTSSPKYSLDSTLSIQVLEQTVNLSVSGVLDNHAYLIKGSLDKFQFGSGEQKLEVSDVNVVIRGTRGTDGKITTSGSLVGTVSLGKEFSTTLTLNLPVTTSSAETVDFTLENIAIGEYFTLNSLKGVLSKQVPYVKLNGVANVVTNAVVSKFEVDASFSGDEGITFTGKIDTLNVNVGEKGFEFKNVILSMTKDSDKKLSTDLKGELTLGGFDAEGSISFISGVRPSMQLSFKNNPSITASTLASTFTNVPSSTGTSESVYNKLLNTHLSIETLSMNLNLEAKTFVLEGLTTISEVIKSVQYRLEVDSTKKQFATGFSMTEAFKLSDVIPEHYNLDGYTIKSGSFVFADHDEVFQLGSKSINCQKGVVFSGEMTLPKVSDQMQTPDVKISGSFASDSHDVHMTGSLSRFQAGTNLRIDSGSVTFSTQAPHLALTTSASLIVGSKTIPFEGSFDYSKDSETEKIIINCSGHVDEFKMNDSVTLKSIDFNLKNEGQEFIGKITSSLVFGTVELKTQLDYPLTNDDYLDLYVPDIHLTDTTHLTDVTLDLSTKSFSDVKFTATFVDTLSSKNSIKLPVSGSFTSESFSMTGEIDLWHVADTGVEASNLKLTLNGKFDESHHANDVTGSVTMDINAFGAEITASLNYPRVGSDIKLAVNHLPIGKEVTVDGSLDLKFDSEGHCEMFTLNGDMDLKLSDSQTTKLTANGYYKKSGDFEINGTANSVSLGNIADNEIVLKELDLTIDGDVSEDQKTTTYTGKMDAKMTLGDITLDVELDYPLKNAEVDLKIPTIRFTKHVNLSNVDLSFEQSSKSIGISGTLNVSFDDESDLNDLALDVNGSITGEDCHLEGSIANWTLPVGHEGTTVTGLKVTVNTTMKDAASHTNVSLEGNVSYAPYDLSLNGTFDSNTDIATMKLSFKNEDSIKLSTLFDKMVTDSSTHEIPQDIHDTITKTTLTSASIELVTKPWNIIIKGDIRAFGNDDLGIQAVVAENSSDKWTYTVALSLTNTFSFTSIIPSATGLNEFKWNEGILAVTNAESSKVEFAGKTITVKDGVFFEAVLPMVNLSQKMQKLKLWSHVESFNFIAEWNKSSSTIQFIAELPENMPVGKDVTVDGKLVINYSPENVSIDIIADGHITLSDKLEPLNASVDIEIDDDGFTLTGSVSEYTVPVGDKGIALETVSIKISEKNGVFKGDLVAKVFIENAELSAEVIIPRSDASKGIEIILKEKNEKLNIQSVLNHTCDSSVSSAVNIPGDMTSVTTNPLLDAEIVIMTEPLSFSIKADVAAFKNKEVVNVDLEITEMNGVWGFGFGIGINSGFKFDDIMPSFGDMSKLAPFVDGAFVIAYQQQPFVYKLGQLEVSMDRGIAFAARAHTHEAIQKWTGIEYVTFKGDIDTATSSIHLEGDLEMNWHLDNLYFYEAGLFLDIGGSQNFDLGVTANMMINFSDHSELKFGVKIMLSVTDIIVDGYTLNDWVNPFGVKGLTIENSEAEIGISYAMVPEMFAISGGLEVGEKEGSLTLYVDPTTGKFVVAGTVSEMNLTNMLTSLTAAVVPSSHLESLSLDLKNLEMELNTGTKAISFNQHTYNPGFLFNVGEFDAFDIMKGEGHIMVNPHVGMTMSGDVQPFDFADGLVKVSGYDGESKPASVDIAVGTGMAHFKVDGRVSIADLMEAAVKIAIDDHGIEVDADLKEGVMDLLVKFHAVTSKAGKPSDFSISAEVDNVDLTALISDIVGRMKVVLEQLLSYVESAKAKINEWEANEQPKIDANNARIQEIINDKEGHYSKEQRAYSDALAELENAQAVLRNYLNTITYYQSQKRDCSWHQVKCKAMNVWLDARIAYTWAVEKAAIGAVNIAESAVRVAKSALGVEQSASIHLNGEIITLKTENAAIETAGKVAEDALSAAEKMVEESGALAQWGMSRLNAAFNLKRAYISADSLFNAKQSGKVKLGVDVQLFGYEFNWSLDTNFPPTPESIEESVWAEVKKHVQSN